MSRLISWCNRVFYPDVPSSWDDLVFRERVLAHLEPHHRLLDLGAGAGILPSMDFRGHAAEICGVDPDERVRENPYLDEARVGVGERIPFEDDAFELVVSDNVLEHLEAPEAVLREVRRVLKPGGRFLAKTPNRWHYMPIVSQLVPSRHHHRVIRGVTSRDAADVFPTAYRANTPAALRRLAARCGLLVRGIEVLDGRPGYLAFSGVSYLLGCLHGLAVRHVPGLWRFGSFLIVVLEKPAGAQEGQARTTA